MIGLGLAVAVANGRAPRVQRFFAIVAGAMKPAVSVNSDEPSSAEVATTPISAGLKPIADR